MTIGSAGRTGAGRVGAGSMLGVAIVDRGVADDSIECLESLLRSPQPMRIVVVAGPASAQRLRAWADGALQPPPANPAMAMFSTPPMPKPLALAEVAAANAGTGWARLTLITLDDDDGASPGQPRSLALRHLFADPAIAAVWLIAADMVVTPDAPAAMFTRIMATAHIGQCGCVIRQYHAPDRLALLNGIALVGPRRYPTAIGAGESITIAYDPLTIADATDAVAMAGIAVTRAFHDRIGLPRDEDDDLVAQLDWGLRNQKAGQDQLVVGFAHGAILFHKAGDGGVPGDVASRTPAQDHALARVTLQMAWRHQRRRWLWIWALGWWPVLARLARRRWRHAVAIVRAQIGLRWR